MTEPALTIVMPYYDNPGMLALQYREWAGWKPELRDAVEVILVDDGSPEAPAAAVERPEALPRLRIYRVLEDRPWHQHAARNLGAHEAEDGWLLLTDMDHVLRARWAARLVGRILVGALDPEAIYMPDRIEADTGRPTMNEAGRPKPHPNSFVMTRNLYWRVGGYDEDYCGVYGTDGLFKARAFAIAPRRRLKGVALTRYWRELVPDASTRTLTRKEGRDPDAKHRVRREKAIRGEADVVKVLQFPWERLV